jgi:acyl-CoA thioesterase
MHPGGEGTAMDVWSVRRAAGVDWIGLAEGTEIERSGRSALWIKVPGGPRMVNAADLALAGDHVPSGAAGALGKMVGGNSLDNTIRVASLVPTAWILADVRIHAVHDGFGHGLCHLWAEDGTLLGTASQSFIVRGFDPDRLKRQG